MPDVAHGLVSRVWIVAVESCSSWAKRLLSRAKQPPGILPHWRKSMKKAVKDSKWSLASLYSVGCPNSARNAFRRCMHGTSIMAHKSACLSDSQGPACSFCIGFFLFAEGLQCTVGGSQGADAHAAVGSCAMHKSSHLPTQLQARVMNESINSPTTESSLSVAGAAGVHPNSVRLVSASVSASAAAAVQLRTCAAGACESERAG